jgi:molybdopterin synthase catalytic subunit
MRVEIHYLGGSREQAGLGHETVDLPEGAVVHDLARWVANAHPELAPRVPRVRFARNETLIELDARLNHGDEIALLPPLSGGARQTAVQSEPLDPSAVLQRCADPSIGATVVFVGTVRRTSDTGASVLGIDYEAYEPMASNTLERLAAEVRDQHGAAEVSIVHRIGHVAVGEAAVVIAASGAHREEAFAACRAAIERLKAEVPIWKRERGDEGAHWVGWDDSNAKP